MYYTYADLYRDVDKYGSEVSARGLKTKEKLGVTLQQRADLLVRRSGKFNRALGYMELCQFIGGVFDKEALIRVAPGAKHELFTKQMAYGPRAILPDYNQFKAVHSELTNDRSSRRAIITIASGRDRPADRPCTQSLQFTIRSGILDCQVYMRSWDLWWGAPYDLILFGSTAVLMARSLGVRPGMLRVVAGSGHIYEPFWGRLVPLASDQLVVDDSVPIDWANLQDWAIERVASTELWVNGVPEGLSEVSWETDIARASLV